jgi:integrase
MKMSNGSRRSSGEGTIWCRRDPLTGKVTRWEARLDLPPGPDGKRRRKTLTGRTRAEVVKRLRAAQDALTKTGVAADDQITVKSYLEQWVAGPLAMKVRNGKIKDSTAEGYEINLRAYVIPRLGHFKLAKLTVEHVEHMLLALEEKGFSANTQRLARTTLGMALQTAVARGKLPNNVARLTEAPEIPASNAKKVMSTGQLDAVLEAIKTDRLRGLWWFLASTGCRKGEALGLLWPSVDLDAGTVTIESTLKRTRRQLVRDTTKTARSTRTLTLPPPLVRELKAHRALQAAERIAAEGYWSGDFVFTTEVGTPIDVRNALRSWKKVLDRSGVGHFTIHNLRHSLATRMRELGVPLEDIADWFGHSNVSITKQFYADVTPLIMARTAEQIATIFGE